MQQQQQQQQQGINNNVNHIYNAKEQQKKYHNYFNGPTPASSHLSSTFQTHITIFLQ